MSDTVGRITQLTGHEHCDCVCHAGVAGHWRSHLCEHCAPSYFARRSARAHEHEHELRQAGQATGHPADHAEQGASGQHSAEQGALST